MANFDEFVQLELPRRPFVGDDGQPGQVLVRSQNANAKRELVWKWISELVADIGGSPPVEVVTPSPALIANDRITLPSQPLGGVIHNMALVYADVTPADFLVDGSLRNRPYVIEEHINIIVEGSAAIFMDAAGSLDGRYAQVSYITWKK